MIESAGMSRASYLDALIAKGDWAGIVATAGKYHALDQQPDPTEQTDEERKALAEATMWQAIADKSKARESGAKDQGARDAADWAISRSLEQKMRGMDSADTSGKGPYSNKPRVVDDQSV